jgi:competence protein ComEC
MDYINNFRLKIGERIISVCDPGPGHILSALTIGEYSGIDRKLLGNIRASGLAHLLAVSGMHVSLVAGICFFFIRNLICLIPGLALRYDSKKTAACFAIIGTFIYLLISGAKVAAIRAFIMCLLFLIAVLFDRNITPIRSVAFAAFAILLVQPEVLFSPSFQMSFAAVVGLICCYQIISSKISFAAFGRNIFTKFILYFSGIVISSLIAGFATMPYSMYHFNQIANYGLIANLVAIPLTSFVLMPLVVINFILFPLGLDYYTLKLASFATKAIVWIANYTASLPHALISPPHMPAEVIGIITIGSLWLLLWQQKWRYLGLLPILAGFTMMKTQELPDIMLDSQKFGYVIYADHNLYSSKQKIPRYTRDNWQRFYGLQKIEKLDEFSNAICQENSCATQLKNQNILITYDHDISQNKCENNNLIINLSDNDFNCMDETMVINKSDLQKNGNIIIYLDKEIKIKTVKGHNAKII